MSSQRSKAELFRKLHHGKHILILPNAWDAVSARIFEETGFPAIATSSSAMMVSLGYPDGEFIDRKELALAVRRIARIIGVPLSADIVGGFGKTAAEVKRTVHDMLKAGAVGINIEDFVHGTRKLNPLEEQVERIKAAIEAGREAGVPLVVNGRTDALRYAKGDDDARFEEAVRRAVAYRDAGADCVYPMGLMDAYSISKFVDALDCPVNVMIRKELPPIDELERLGVARVSFGPSGAYIALSHLKIAATEVLEIGTYETLTRNVMTFDELNSLGRPKSRHR